MTRSRRIRSSCVRHMGTAMAASTTIVTTTVKTSATVKRKTLGERTCLWYRQALPGETHDLATRPARGFGRDRPAGGHLGICRGRHDDHDTGALAIDGAPRRVARAGDLEMCAGQWRARRLR